jgi:chromosome segregation ATPase
MSDGNGSADGVALAATKAALQDLAQQRDAALATAAQAQATAAAALAAAAAQADAAAAAAEAEVKLLRQQLQQSQQESTALKRGSATLRPTKRFLSVTLRI